MAVGLRLHVSGLLSLKLDGRIYEQNRFKSKKTPCISCNIKIKSLHDKAKSLININEMKRVQNAEKPLPTTSFP